MKILLIDVNALFHRSYHAFAKNGMMTSKGVETWGVYGFIKTLIEQANSYKADLVIACDDSGNYFRRSWNAEYKANRKPKPKVFYDQKKLLDIVLPELGVPIFRIDSYEADDIINTFLSCTILLEDLEGSVVPITNKHFRISTVDGDLLKLVSDICEVNMWQGSNVKVYSNQEQVKDYLGVYPKQVTDMKALCGDSSDNIAGIPKFGPETAKVFFNQYSNLQEGKTDNFQKLPEKLQKMIIPNLKVISDSYTLANLYEVSNFTPHLKVLPERKQEQTLVTTLECRSLDEPIKQLSFIPTKKVEDTVVYDLTQRIAENQKSSKTNSFSTVGS